MASKALELTDAQIAKGNFGGCRSRADLAAWLVRELDDALASRGDVADRIRYWWAYYNQERTRASSPWPDAADLTSPYGTEFVDAILSRLMDTVMVEPVCLVEGWGEAAKRAPFVEEFHQRAQEQERLQGYFREVFLRALIEPAGILDIADGVDWTRQRKTIKARMVLNEEGGPVLGEDAKPLAQQDESGQYVEAGEGEPFVELEIDAWEPIRLGPVYDVVPYLDYLRLPTHARAKSELWGHAKRFFRRVPELQSWAKRGIYDAKAVEALGESDERQLDAQGVEPAPSTVVDQTGPTAQKELWEVALLADLDGEGARWWIVTVSKQHTQLLRLQVDTREQRFVEFVPFRKPGQMDGYSLIEKMQTLLEQDSAVRNMWADSVALSIGGAYKRLSGALWDPFEQPIGPGEVIEVRDMNEIQPLAPPIGNLNALTTWQQSNRADVERQMGLNDVAVGTQTSEKRTLGEVRLAAGYSEVRVKAIVTAIQEAIEEVYQVRHAIWKRTLAAMPKGLPAPNSLMQAMDARGVEMETLQTSGRITAEMLDGLFWFKPRGSVETANLDAQAQNFLALLRELPALLAINPALRALFTTPQASKALVEQMLRVTRWPDKQAILGSEGQRALTKSMEQANDMASFQQMQQHPVIQAMQALAQAEGGGVPPAPQQGMGAAMGAAPAAEGAPI